MFETLALELQRMDPIWIGVGWLIFGLITFLVIRELNAWFWKVNSIIDTQESILSTLEDIRELLSAWVDEPVEEKKETVTEMLEKKPKKVKEEKENPQK